jgi:membrane-associated phospholipid phosphatase
MLSCADAATGRRGWHARQVVDTAVEARAVRRRLVPEQLRRAAGWTAVVATAIVAVLGITYAGSSSAGSLDRALDRPLTDRFHDHELFVLRMADLGSTGPLMFLTVLAAVLAVSMRRPRALLLLILALPVAIGITEWVIKPLVHRTKDGSLVFPSGHTTGVSAFAFVVAILMLDPTYGVVRRFVQGLVALGALLLAVSVAAALASSGFHYAMDTVGGACVALATVLWLSLALDSLAERRAGG